MKKIILILIASFFYFNLASAGLEGSGPVKLDSEVLKYFKRYLGAKNQQSTGALKHGRGDYFFISESGIKSRKNLIYLQENNINVFLIGESLMKGDFF